MAFNLIIFFSFLGDADIFSISALFNCVITTLEQEKLDIRLIIENQLDLRLIIENLDAENQITVNFLIW